MVVRIADWCFRRRFLVVVLWVAALAGSIALSNLPGGPRRSDFLPPGTEATAAQGALARAFPQKAGSTLQIVVHDETGVGSGPARQRAEALFAEVSGRPHVVGLTSPFSTRGSGQLSPDGRTAYATVDLDRGVDAFTAEQAAALVGPILSAGDRRDGLQVEVSGDVAALSQNPPLGSEGIGLLLAALILALTFGSMVAMGLPLLSALFGLGVALSLAAVVARFVPVLDGLPEVAAMVGIGVGIDYALLIVTRYRTALADGQAPRSAVATAMATAGKAVIFAGATVMVSVLGLLGIDQPFVPGFVVDTLLVVAVVVVASVTLLPAALGFAGTRIDRLRIPFAGRVGRADDSGFWLRWSRVVQARPLAGAIASLVVLLALAAPFLGIRFGYPDASSDPTSYTTRRAYDLLAEGFGPGFGSPMLLVVQGGPGVALPAAAEAVAAGVRRDPGVASVSPAVPNPAADTALVSVVPTTSPQDPRTAELLTRLRTQDIPGAVAGTGARVLVGGAVALQENTSRSVSSRLPFVIAGVVLTAFVLLTLAFGSVLVPIQAAVTNLLSVGAAFGVLALACGGGAFGALVGIPEPTPVPVLMPMMLFAILFGLSMDYGVFLLSRVKEEYDRHGDNSRAVAVGVARTGRVITASAAIMVVVFGSFVPSQSVLLKMFGLGLATAILVDATLVRMVLVPATLELFGERNWWLPGWLRRALPTPRVHHEVPAGPRPVVVSRG